MRNLLLFTMFFITVNLLCAQDKQSPAQILPDDINPYNAIEGTQLMDGAVLPFLLKAIEIENALKPDTMQEIKISDTVFSYEYLDAGKVLHIWLTGRVRHTLAGIHMYFVVSSGELSEFRIEKVSQKESFLSD